MTHDQAANDLLLDDLRADAGMGWVPQSAWLTKLEVNSTAADLQYDLAVDTSGADSPSRVAAGLELPGYLESIPHAFDGVATTESDGFSVVWPAVAAAAVLAIVFLLAGLPPRFRRG